MAELNEQIKTKTEKKNDEDIFTEESEVTDLTLVEDKKIFVNKNVLMVASPVFRAMFLSDFKEKDASALPLPGKNIQDCIFFLRCLYPDIMDPIMGSNVYKVLPLADEYQCNRLKQRCEEYLLQDLGSNSSIAKAIKCAEAAEKHGLGKLLHRCAEVLCNKSLNLLQKRWTKLSAGFKVEISTKRIAHLEEFCTNAQGHVSKFKDIPQAYVKFKDLPEYRIQQRAQMYEEHMSVMNEIFRYMPGIFEGK